MTTKEKRSTLYILFREICKREGQTIFDPEKNIFVAPDGTIVTRPDQYIKLDFHSSYGGYRMELNRGGTCSFLMGETRYTLGEMTAFIRGYLAAKKP